MAERRLDFARKNKGDIHVVAIQDRSNSNYVNGLLLAKEIINQRPDKLLGRDLNIHIEHEGDDFSTTKSTIERIAINPKIVAVLGHRRSVVAVPASVIYENSQVIFMPSFSTAKALTGHGFDYVFRMVPNTEIMTGQLASVAKTLGYQKWLFSMVGMT
jgi:branched-chain amino acid transport system substrate-binding protein